MAKHADYGRISQQYEYRGLQTVPPQQILEKEGFDMLDDKPLPEVSVLFSTLKWTCMPSQVCMFLVQYREIDANNYLKCMAISVQPLIQYSGLPYRLLPIKIH